MGLLSVVANTVRTPVTDAKTVGGKFKSAIKTVDSKYKLRRAQETTHNMVREMTDKDKMSKKLDRQETLKRSEPSTRISQNRDSFDSTDSNSSCLPAMRSGQINEEQEFLNWALGSVSIPEEKQVEVSPQFQQSMKHKMLCWDVFQGERHKAPEKPTKGQPSGRFATA